MPAAPVARPLFTRLGFLALVWCGGAIGTLLRYAIEEAVPAVSADDPDPASTLPKTGSGDSMPVIALWALALTLLGAAGLLCVPQARGKH